jgi:mycothiol system anti-sigma-R factor
MSESLNPFVFIDGKKPSCMQMLQVILDEQATPEQRDYFKVHMDRCMPCFKSYNLDATIKDLLKSKCCGGEAPHDLLEGIKQKINQQLSL